ncbi:MAG: hypothetical protein AUK55_08045 [Syntrophobacteraceae bacterium CG2_30_61_12]|nr:MAG: hypothetical protein AUK55_08045 [Syntrophobacteraceae bacterium CG2_30_61_12]
MSRPRKCRRILGTPRVTYFKPQGIPMTELDEVVLSYEGHEALRFADLEGLGQEEAAQSMGVSRHTFGRILADARRVVAQAVIHGMALRIQGGDYVVAGCQRATAGRGPGCGSGKGFADDATDRMQPTVKECNMSKIAITSEGPRLDDQMDSRFGRAAGFVVVDLETMETQYIDNGQSQVMAQGAGIQAAELIARAGVSCVLTGFVGPKAFRALSAAGIKVGQNLEGITVREAVERFKNGSVELADRPNREGGR